MRPHAFQGKLALVVQLIDQLAGHTDVSVAGIEPVGIDAISFKIFDFNSQGIALDAGIDVLGDENSLVPLLVQGVRDGQDAVIRDVAVDMKWRRLIATVNAQSSAEIVDRHALEQSAAGPQTEA